MEFAPLYIGQPLFAEVDQFMRTQGFALYDLRGPYRFPRAASPLVDERAPGQVRSTMMG